MVVGAAHSFLGLGFFVLLNCHDSLLVMDGKVV